MKQGRLKITDLPPRYQEQAYEQISGKPLNSLTNPAPHMEPDSGNAPLAKKETKGLNPPYRIHVHSIRNRLTDADGVSGKAAIDGLVLAGLLPDDSPQFVQEVTYSQEKTAKGEAETTVLTITEVER